MNNNYSIKRYICTKAAQKCLPVTGTFELTARCNFHCQMCYIRKSSKEASCTSKELSAKEWISLGKECADAGLVFLLLTGGEPMLRKDFPEIYKGLTDLGLSISINTNGSLITDSIKELFEQTPPALVNVSLYSISNEKYKSFYEADNGFDRVMSNLRWLKSKGITFNVNSTITPENVSELTQLRDIADKEGFNLRTTAYNFPPVRRDNSEGFARLSADMAGKLLAQDILARNGRQYAASLLKNADLSSGVIDDCCMNTGESMGCLAGKSQFWVTWDGKMTPCGMLNTPVSYPLDTGFKEAWSNIVEETQRIRLCPDCMSCKDKLMCTNCAAVTSAETGRFDGKPEYMCEVTRAYRQELERITGEISE
ncbi:MAG: radical SAM protein [Eubacteriales bacterium]|nr:radical SAM protein [Eubacteriales bacterium]